MKTYNLFISHSWAHSDNYQKLESLLRKRSYFEFKDYSVPKNDPIHTNGTDRQLYDAILRKMQPCSVILILAGVYSTYSKWIEKEIKIAKEEFSVQKPIIAIEPRGSERTSQIIKNNADRIVGWNTNSVVDAIRALA
ncbi:MAG: TIR domain-containing protein [Nitrospira sp.]|nr:TIR domain-containing protein [Nitrospira sp.]